MKKLLSVFFILLCVFFISISAQADETDNRIFRFYTGEELYQLLAVKDGENLTEPAAPSAPEGQRFDGWYADEACTQPFTFGVQTTRNNTTTVYAKFIQTFCFTYYDELGNVLLNEELVSGTSYTFDKDNPAYAVTAIDKVNNGWKDQHGTVHTTDTIAVTEDLILQPVPETGFYARFFTQGGSFVHSQLILPGQKAARPDQDPTRAGYTFDNWYTEAAGGSLFDFDAVPTRAVNIYAHWTANTDTPYKVVLWVENTDGGYDYGASITKTGTTGGDVSFDPATDAASDSADKALYNVMRIDSATSSRRYELYVFEDDKNAEMVSEINRHGGIQGDGTTLLNVYARRKRFTLRLQDRDTGAILKTYDGEEKRVVNKYYDYSEIWAAYGYNTSVLWVGGTSLGGSAVSQDSRPRINFPYHADLYGRDIPDGAVLTYQLYTATGSHFRRERYYQRLDDPTGNDRDQYELGYVLEFVASAGITGAKQSDDIGFYVDHSMTTGWATHDPSGDHSYSFTPLPNVLKFYMRRMKYTLSFNTGIEAAVIPDREILYEEPIAGYIQSTGYIPDQKIIERDGIKYVFKGWYDNSNQAGEPITAFTDRIMSDCNLGLFAKWEPLAYTVKFDPAMGEEGGSYTGPTETRVIAGDKVSQPVNPTRNQRGEWKWTFLGWALDGKPYDFDSAVPEDNITLVAQWSRLPLPKVSYSAGDGSGRAPEDEYYRTYSVAIAPTGEGLKAPAGEHFIGWMQDGKLYYPGDEIAIGEEDLTLTAAFAADGNTVYTVRYYKQETGDSYQEDPVQTKQLTGRIRSTVTADEIQYPGYTLEPDISTQSGILAPDGSLTLSMYYAVKTYTVTWLDGDENELKTDTLTEGATPAYTGATPTKSATAQYLYTFSNTWSPEITAVNGNAVYTAQFSQTLQKYTVTWENDDHTILETDEYVPYGETPRYDGKTPEKAPTNEFTYTFDGWNREIAAVTGKTTYTAVYKATAVATATPSATPSPTPTAEPTTSPTAFRTETPTESPAPSLTPSPTQAPAPSPTPKPVPKTGEKADPLLYLALAMLGIAGAGATVLAKRKKQ